MSGLFITGTDTGIGKTLVTALLALGLRQLGRRCVPIKPIGSGAVMQGGTAFTGGRAVSEDALAYQQIAGVGEALSLLNPLCLIKPASPHLAAELEGRAIDTGALVKHVGSCINQFESVLVEGVGGWRVPITRGYGVNDFARELGLPVLVVSANRLGTINHTLLTVEAIRQTGLKVAGVVMSSPEPEQDETIANDNIKTIAGLSGAPILGEVPYLDGGFFAMNIQQKWQRIQPMFGWAAITAALDTR